jgi:hypothetical protein
MTQEMIEKAEAECLRFLGRVNAMKALLETRGEIYSHPSKESSAMLRASLDLTRALAELRRSR